MGMLVAAILAAVSLTGCDMGSTGNPHSSSSDSPTRSTATPHPSPEAETTQAAPRPTRPVDPDAHRQLVDHVRWTRTSKGRQLQVFPTKAGRTDMFPTAAKHAWGEILAHAPSAASVGMYDQFLCHWNYARVVEPDKPSWNLEPWRPAVGYAATVAALCNPGGSEG